MFPFPYPEARVTDILYGQLGLCSFVVSLTLIITLYILLSFLRSYSSSSEKQTTSGLIR